jgi:hypothetical protein
VLVSCEWFKADNIDRTAKVANVVPCGGIGRILCPDGRFERGFNLGAVTRHAQRLDGNRFHVAMFNTAFHLHGGGVFHRSKWLTGRESILKIEEHTALPFAGRVI